MSGSAKVFLERLSQQADSSWLAGKGLGVFVLGADPTDAVTETTAIVERFAGVQGMTFVDLTA